MTDYVICAKLPSMQTTSLALNDADEIAEFYRSTTGMSPEYLQLNAGRGGISIQVDELDGVTLVWAEAAARSRWRDQFAADGFQFGCVLDSSGPVNVLGRDIDQNVAAIWLPGQEMDYVLNGPYQSLEISVDQRLMTELGWDLSGDPLSAIDGNQLRALIDSARAAARWCRAERPSNNTQLALDQHRDQLLLRLSSVLERWQDEPEPSPRRSARRVFTRAEQYLEGIKGEPLDVALLAETLGISRRTLHRAFDDQVGLGPRRYYEVMRLAALRARLRAARPGAETVTELATALGFHDLGRLSGLYRQQYGEYPRETLMGRGQLWS